MKAIIVILLFTFQTLNAQTNNITGTWKGDLVFGERKMDIILDFVHNQSSLSGKLSSQSQQLKDIPLSKIQFQNTSLSFEVPLAGGKWSGELSNANELNGTWIQGPYEIPLNFKKQQNSIEFTIKKRVQTPVAPFPYHVEEVNYLNTRDNIKLAATLTIPKGEGPFPAAILLTVAGPNDRNQTHGSPQHKPFMVLADYLTKHGIAVLRADDRGVGGSEGNVFESTIEDFAHDAIAGLTYLKQRKEVDPSKIGFIGNSEGSLVGPLAASIQGETAFIITLGGISIPGSEVMLDQADAIGKIANLNQDQIKSIKGKTESVFEILRQEPDNNKVKKKLLEVLKDQDSNPSYSEEFLIPSSPEEQVRLFATDWYRFQMNYDPAPVLQKTTIPFLAIHGDIDPFVNPDKNIKAFTNHLAKAGNKEFAVVKIKNLNHVFQDANSGSPRAYNQNEISFSPRALRLIQAWLSSILH